jgi:crooked neck
MDGGGGADARVTVQNKAPNPVQITAEQLLRNAHDMQDAPFKQPKQNITDPEELAAFQ